LSARKRLLVNSEEEFFGYGRKDFVGKRFRRFRSGMASSRREVRAFSPTAAKAAAVARAEVSVKAEGHFEFVKRFFSPVMRAVKICAGV